MRTLFYILAAAVVLNFASSCSGPKEVREETVTYWGHHENDWYDND